MINKKETFEQDSVTKRDRKLTELTAEYLEDLPQQLANLKAALENQNYTFIEAQAHNIKGTSGTHQLNTIYEKAVQLERLADNQSEDEILNTINEITNLVEEEIRRLNPEILPAACESEKVEISDYKPIVLAVDDDLSLLDVVREHIQEWGYIYRGVSNQDEMWQELESVVPGVILLDVKLGDDNGIEFLPELKQQFPYVPVIMITADTTIETAVKSIRNGAYDFICKPLDFNRLHIEINRANEHNRLLLQVNAYQDAKFHTDFHGMIGRSKAMRKIYRLIETIAPTDAAVLVLGETGTGKELAARAIHECSSRCNSPFIAVNMPAIPNELIESALFGHEKGAFTGAHQQHTGYCEQAKGGTLFLDEICEIDYRVQAKLLRFLESHMVQRVGAKYAQEIDVRIVAATNRDPNVQIQNNELREDLFYRLSTVNIELPPLRQRPGDISLLTNFFVDFAAAKYGKNMSTVLPEAMKLLETYNWSGNIRQLEHVIARIVITNNETELTVDMLPPEITEQSCANATCTNLQTDKKEDKTILSLQEMEQQLILEALELTSGSVPKAAKHLGINEVTLYRKIKKFGLTRTFVKQ